MDIIYTTIDSVKVRLSGKVQFQTADQEEGELTDVFLKQLICDAETEVEQELRSRYAIPFQSKTTKTFDGLPDHSKRAIRTVIDMKAVMNVLSTDFGRGSHISGDNYYEKTKERYDNDIIRLLGRDTIASSDKIDRYKYSPPLEGMMLAESNRAADDGYRGMIINTDASRNDAASYAENSINNPGQTYFRKRGNGSL